MSEMSFQQNQIQTQLQIMSQRQIQSLEILSLGVADLREAIYKAVDENPALGIVEDRLASGADVKKRNGTFDNTRVSSVRSFASDEASDTFQATLEAQEDKRESLQEHLMRQWNTISMDSHMHALGEKLIYNLSENGFHRLAPVSLLNVNDSSETPGLLEKCISMIQALDPPGTCTSSPEESLLVQARLLPDAPDIALLILDGHFDFLNPPVAAKVEKKILSFLDEQKKMFASVSVEKGYDDIIVNEERVQDAIDFIRTLDPYPARDYTVTETHFVAPEIYVTEIPSEEISESDDSDDSDDEKSGVVWSGGKALRVKVVSGSLPRLGVNREFVRLSKADKGVSAQEKKLLSSSVKKAQDFMQILEMRKNTLEKAAFEIVRIQGDFFSKGPGFLKPFKQSELAEILGVHESTVSRLANEKYLQCKWGLFELKYFFSAAVMSAGGDVSRDSVLMEISKILEEHKDDKKKLSDQKLCDILAERGIKIARRTVAKYRSQLNIASSYAR